MSRRTSGHQVGVALFPFLAVLLCTMGCLIVLLLMVVQQARIGAKAAAAQVLAQQSKDNDEVAQQVQQETDDTLLRNDQLSEQLAELQKLLSDKRLEMSAIEENIRKVEDDLKKLEALGKEIIVRSRSSEVASADQKLLDELEKKIDSKKKELDEARKLAAKKKPEFSIVPYEGPNGTSRRPIFVECRIDGVILQPEGIILNPNDFEGPMGPGNPLDAALRAVREHLKNNGLEGEPYPLIVVRPSGAMAYMASRKAMAHWDNEFGYELVEEEIDLRYPKADPALQAVVKRALKDARDRQAAMIAAMPKRFSGSQVGDSFEVEPDEDLSGSGAGGSGSGGSGTGGSGKGSAGLAGGGNAAVANGKGTGTSGRLGSAFANGSGSPTANTVASSAYGSAASKLRGGPGMGGSGMGGGGDGSGGTGTTPGTGAPMLSGGGGSAGSRGQGADGIGTSGSPTGGSGGSSATGQGGGAAGSAGGRPGASGGSSSNNSSTAGAGAAGSGQAGASGSSAAGSSSAKGSGSGMSGGSAAAADDMRGQQAGAQSVNMEYRPDVNKAKATSSKMTRQKGEGWGLKGTGAMGSGGTRMSEHATAVSRPIQVRCTRSQVVVIPDRDDTRRASVVQLPGDLASNVDPFLSAVRKRVEFWGPPVDGGYWKPVLSVEVAPDAEERYQELTALLQGSGFDVQRKVKR